MRHVELQQRGKQDQSSSVQSAYGSNDRMCPGSPVCAASTGATAKQALERVDAGRMSITPLDLEPVGTHQGYAQGPDVSRNGCRIEQRSATHLLYTRRTGTSQPQRSGGIEALMSILVPLDLQPVVLAINGVRYGVHSVGLLGYRLLAIGVKTRNPPGHWRVSHIEQLTTKTVLGHQILEAIAGFT